jgi:hypothetical protein
MMVYFISTLILSQFLAAILTTTFANTLCSSPSQGNEADINIHEKEIGCAIECARTELCSSYLFKDANDFKSGGIFCIQTLCKKYFLNCSSEK